MPACDTVQTRKTLPCIIPLPSGTACTFNCLPNHGFRKLRLHLRSCPMLSHIESSFPIARGGPKWRACRPGGVRRGPDLACTSALFGAGRQREARRGRGEPPLTERAERRLKGLFRNLLDFGLSDLARITAGLNVCGATVQQDAPEFMIIHMHIAVPEDSARGMVPWRPTAQPFPASPTNSLSQRLCL